MADNTVIGTARRAAGRVERAAGNLIGDAGTELRGRAREFGGAVQQRYGETNEATRNLIGGHSLAALLAAGTVGLIAGLLLARRP